MNLENRDGNSSKVELKLDLELNQIQSWFTIEVYYAVWPQNSCYFNAQK